MPLSKSIDAYSPIVLTKLLLSNISIVYFTPSSSRTQTLVEAGAVKNRFDAVKILGNGDLTKKLTVKANAFSEGAKAKIEAVGGNVEVI